MDGDRMKYLYFMQMDDAGSPHVSGHSWPSEFTQATWRGSTGQRLLVGGHWPLCLFNVTVRWQNPFCTAMNLCDLFCT